MPFTKEMLPKVCVPVKVFELFWKQVPPMARQPFERFRPPAKVEVAFA